MSIIRKFIRVVLSERVRSSTSNKFQFEEFKKLNSISKIFTYAHERLQYISHGSSRAVFVLTGNKVLKVALNDAGIAQNEQEVEVYTNPATKPIITKIYNNHPEYRWLISETVRQFKDQFEIEKYLDLGIFHDWQVTFDQFIELAVAGNFEVLKNLERTRHQNSDDLIKLAKSINDMCDSAGITDAYGDLLKADSWGKTFDGRMVLLDFGFNDEIASTHYPENVV